MGKTICTASVKTSEFSSYTPSVKFCMTAPVCHPRDGEVETGGFLGLSAQPMSSRKTDLVSKFDRAPEHNLQGCLLVSIRMHTTHTCTNICASPHTQKIQLLVEARWGLNRKASPAQASLRPCLKNHKHQSNAGVRSHE